MTRLVVLAWGNPSRGDDALGPEFLRRIEPLAVATPQEIDLVTDFQLQPEHAADLAGRDLALFVDASVTAPAPFAFDAVVPARDRTFTSHALSPAALLAVCAEAFPSPLPASFVLAIRGQRYALGEPIGPAAAVHLDQAVAFARWLFANPERAAWRAAVGERAPRGAVPGAVTARRRPSTAAPRFPRVGLRGSGAGTARNG